MDARAAGIGAASGPHRRERRPLYKAIYSFVFGDGDPGLPGWDAVEKKAFVAFVQANKGVVTMPEFMALTGLGPPEAETRINRYLYEFEGSPEVTEGGAIYYFFPSLMRRKDKADRSFGGTPDAAHRRVFRQPRRSRTSGSGSSTRSTFSSGVTSPARPRRITVCWRRSTADSTRLTWS